MKLFFHILCAIICVTSLSAMDINFFADAETFYKRDGGILARSEPLDVYNQIIEDKPISAQRAKQALHSLRSILAIRKQLSEKYPGARLFDRRSGGFFGGPSPDYTENALTIISAKLAEKAGENREAPMPLESIRIDIVEKITPLFTQAENARLNKLVELETRASETKTPQRTLDIEKLARELGVIDQLPQEFKEQPEVPTLPPPKETVETRKQRLMRKIDDIIDALNTGAETVDVGEAKFNTGISSILERRPKNIPLKDINATAQAIIAAVAGGDWSSLEWNKYIEAQPEVSASDSLKKLKEFLSEEKNHVWVLFKQPGMLSPTKFLSELAPLAVSQDPLPPLIGKVIATVFEAIDTMLKKPESRLWANYEPAHKLIDVLNEAETKIDISLPKYGTRDLFKALEEKTKNLPIGKAYRINEVILQKWLMAVVEYIDLQGSFKNLSKVIIALISELNNLDALDAEWIKTAHDFSKTLTQIDRNTLIDSIAQTIFAEIYHFLLINPQKPSEETTLLITNSLNDWFETFKKAGIVLTHDEIESLQESVIDGSEFIEIARPSKFFRDLKTDILKTASEYVLGKETQNDTVMALVQKLGISLPEKLITKPLPIPPIRKKDLVDALSKFAESLTVLANTAF